MTINLTTPQPFEQGHGRPTLTYPQVMAVQIDQGVVGRHLTMHMQYGDHDGEGEWVGSPNFPAFIEVIENFAGIADGEGGWIEEPDPVYDLFILSTYPASTSNPLYDENSDALYQYLLDDGRYEGTIAT